MTLTRDFSYDQLATIKAFFTDGEWDTIANALEDYRHYDNEDQETWIEGRSVYERVNEIDDRINKLYARTK